VEAKGPADKAGVLPGDILLSADGVPITTTEDLQEFSQKATIGKATKIKFIRGGGLNESSIIIGERPRRRK